MSPPIRAVFRSLSVVFLLTAVSSCRTAPSGRSAPKPLAEAPPNVAPKTLPVSLTPLSPETPRINGPRVFGVRPGSPFLYAIPTTGRRPIEYSADALPSGLHLDVSTGRITGKLWDVGEHRLILRAENDLGKAEIAFRIIVGDKIALTPPMGWNSWNCWAGAVDQEKVLRSANAMVKSGLSQHGWTYINIDDTWQGQRGGPYRAIQPNGKFGDMKELCDEIHALGLKAGIYSTPWTTSYAVYPGGSSESPDGVWTKPTIPKKGNVNKKKLPWAVGRYHFMTNDARQWAEWGFDYLKYDWNPIEPPDVKEMADALRSSGRDIVYSLSNNAPLQNAPACEEFANCWRTTGDIRDRWDSVLKIGFTQDPWASFAGPGHWNDPDMLVVGYVGWGPKLHSSNLTPDEQYTHISLWCLLSAPLLIGCDLNRLDAFTLGLLTNDEVLAVDQDELGVEAKRAARHGDIDIYVKPLADGSLAVGLFNLGPVEQSATVTWSELGLPSDQKVRDLWRQRDLGVLRDHFTASVAPHGVALIRIAEVAAPSIAK